MKFVMAIFIHSKHIQFTKIKSIWEKCFDLIGQIKSGYSAARWRILKVIQQGQHRFDTATNTQNDPTRTSTGPGAESDIYDFFAGYGT